MKKIIQIISLASEECSIVARQHLLTINLHKSSSSENDLHSYVHSSPFVLVLGGREWGLFVSRLN